MYQARNSTTMAPLIDNSCLGGLLLCLSSLLSAQGFVVLPICHRPFITSPQWASDSSSSSSSSTPTIVHDESASDQASLDNPPPAIKIIECPEDAEDMPFYTLGVNLAMQVGDDLGTLLSERECDLVAKGFGEHLKGTLTNQGLDGKTLLQNFGPAANILLQERTRKLAQGNKQAGQEYIEQFLKEHPTAQKTDSGLVYLETQQGRSQTKPSLQSTIEFHYHGVSAVDGKVVDSSILRQQSQTIPLNQAIVGLREGLLRMNEGTKSTLVIPSDLAYGDSGKGPIPGGSSLQFEVELIRVLPAADAQGTDEL
jgi:FKBP-type peptidyl-prolyl cis-trans isomerase